jgi:hypothetical protein
LALSRIGQGSVAAASGSPTVAAGDLVVVLAYNSAGTTIPSLPTDWTNINSAANSGGGTNCAARCGYRVAPTGGLSSTGTWTNATHLVWLILRGQKVSGPIGGNAINGGNNAATTVTYPAVNLTGGQTGQWLLGMAGRATADNTLATAPSGMTNHTDIGAPTRAAAHSTDDVRSTNWSATNVGTFGASAKFSAIVIEVLEEPPPPADPPGPITDYALTATSASSYTRSATTPTPAADSYRVQRLTGYGPWEV